MSAATNIIKGSLDMAAYCVTHYMEGLSDEDLLIRPVEGANHMAWQLGHAITAEHDLVKMVCPNSMPALPDGFSEHYSKEASKLDVASAFHDWEMYSTLMNEQRMGTLAALEKLGDDDLEQPAPEAIREYAPTVGATFALVATHWMMHSGQWVVLRRKLRREPLF